MLINIFGFLAALTSTISLIPQIIKMYRTRSVEDISILMIINFLLTSIFWVLYGVMIESISVWSTNCLMLVLAVIMLIFKIQYKVKVNNAANI